MAKKKVTAEMMRLVQRKLASAGGKARAAKYDHRTLVKWAKLGGKLGGRPRKDQAKKNKRGKS